MATGNKTLDSQADFNLANFIEPHSRVVKPTNVTKPRTDRKIIIKEWGGYFKAHYEGSNAVAFGATADEATRRVKLFSRGGKHSPVFKESDYDV